MYLVFIVGTFTRCFVVKYGRPLFLIYMGGQVTSFILSNRYRRQWRRNEFESGGTDPAPKVDGTDPAQSAGNFFWSCPSTFLALKVQLVVLVSAFVMVSTVWSVLAVFLLTVPPRAQPFVKVGALVPPCPMESAPLITAMSEVRGMWLTCASYACKQQSRNTLYENVRIFRCPHANSLFDHTECTSNMAAWFYAQFNDVTVPHVGGVSRSGVDGGHFQADAVSSYQLSHWHSGL